VSRLKNRVRGMGARQKPAPPRPLPPPLTAGPPATGNSSPPAPSTSGGPYTARAAAPGAGGGAASPPAVMVMPLQQVIVYPAASPYVTLGMEDLAPIWTTDGAAVPATARGRWGQLRAAGRP